MGKFSMRDDIKLTETSMGGGSFLWDSGVYECTVDMAYFDVSQGGANSLNLTILNSEGKKLKQTFWFTNRKNGITFADQKGENKYLPGYVLANNLCLIVTEKDINESYDAAKTKTINVYDFVAKKEKPTEKLVAVNLLSKKIKVAVLKQIVNKRVKQGNEYVNSAETRDENDIKEFYFDDTGLTVVEKANGLTEAILIHKWDERNKGKIISRVKEVTNNTVNTTQAEPVKKIFT